MVKAHYGRYYKALEPGEFRRRGAVDLAGLRASRSTRRAIASNFVQTSSNANLRIDPDFKAPYNDQFMVQLEQELRRRTSACR